MPSKPWASAYAPGVPIDIEAPTGSLVEPLFAAAQRFADHIALDFLGATTTYRDLVEQVQHAAGALHEAGIKPGDRVAIALPNCPQHVVAFYAAQRIGAIVVEINPTFTAREIAHELVDTGARFVVCWQKLLGTMQEASSGTAVERIVSADMVTDMPLKLRLAVRLPLQRTRKLSAQLRGDAHREIEDFGSFVESAQPLADDHPLPDGEATAVLLFTSGTTGEPRAAMLSHRNLLSVSAMGEAWVPQLKPGREVFVSALPFFHSFGMQLCLLFGIRMGARCVLLPNFSVSQVLAAQRRCPITFFPGVPAMFQRLASRAKERNVDLSSIRIALSGAMALPLETAQAWEEATGGAIVEGYGMTETAPITIGNPVHSSRRPGWAGIPFPSTEARIVSAEDTAEDVPTGETGELLVRGPQVTSGYWNRPKETAACQVEGGWWRTGDIARMDPSGFVKIVDRSKELIITGGYNVYPSQVEELVRQMPQVSDVAVVGLPAEGAMGERVVAAIVLAADTARLDLEQVREWCADRLAQYAWPGDIVLLDELPKSQIGKVLRRVVRDQLLALPAPAV